MAKRYVNLDALIRREDFEVEGDQSSAMKTGGNIKLSEIETGSIIFQMLRKPDFQRETANWTPQKVVELIRGFVDGDLIPSIIMWRSQKSGNIFVIDGAHRLSAYIAWVHDDYGDRQISTQFFGNSIRPEQRDAADETRDMVNSVVGSYETLKFIAQHQDRGTAEQVRRAKNAGVIPIELQWVTGDATKAEASFFTINQSATEIDETELSIIKARRKPNAVAARAIIRAGTGHKYWKFGDENRREVERLGKEICEILFDPSLQTPIKTLDLPVAGNAYSADSLALTFEFINLVKSLKPEAWIDEPAKKRKPKEPRQLLPDDEDGSATIECLKAVKNIATRISGNLPRSLGLHPAVYFYGATGRYQPAAFLAAAALVKQLAETDGFIAFTEARDRFEEFILKFGYFKNQIVGSYGGGTKSVDPILKMYLAILDGIWHGRTDDEIVSALRSQQRFRCLKERDEGDLQMGQNFTRDTKSAAFLREAIDGAVRCKICNARVHVKGVSVDHAIPKHDGGDGSLDNAQITHPYCNTGYKQAKIAAERAECEPAAAGSL